MSLYFKAEITNSVWADLEYLPFTFAIIDDIFYIQKIDQLNRKYWKILDINTFDDKAFSNYFASIQYFFYRRLNDNSIPKNVWEWIEKRIEYMQTEAIHDADFLSDDHDDYENFVKRAFSDIYYSIDAMKLLLKELETRNKLKDCYGESSNRDYLIKIIKERIQNETNEQSNSSK